MHTLIINKFSHYLLIAAFSLCFCFCRSPQKLMDKKQYDKAIQNSVKRLAKKKSDKTTLILETSFKKVMYRDLRSIDSLKLAGQPNDWETIHEIYSAIDNRQQLIKSITPLYIKEENNRLVNFQFIDVAAGEEQAKRKAAEYLYAHAKELLEQGKLGDKVAARQAYEELGKIEQYYPNYRNQKELREQAFDLGKSTVAVKLENETSSTLPLGFEDELMRFSQDDLNHFWLDYDFNPAKEQTYDFYVFTLLHTAEVSEELETQRQYQQHKTVQDGVREIRDSTGITTIPNYVRVDAQITEFQQWQSAKMEVELVYVHTASNKERKRTEIFGEEIFEHFYCTYYGDQRALDIDSRRCIQQRRDIFPSEDDLFTEANRKLRTEILKSLDANEELLME